MVVLLDRRGRAAQDVISRWLLSMRPVVMVDVMVEMVVVVVVVVAVAVAVAVAVTVAVTMAVAVTVAVARAVLVTVTVAEAAFLGVSPSFTDIPLKVAQNLPSLLLGLVEVICPIGGMLLS